MLDPMLEDEHGGVGGFAPSAPVRVPLNYADRANADYVTSYVNAVVSALRANPGKRAEFAAKISPTLMTAIDTLAGTRPSSGCCSAPVSTPAPVAAAPARTFGAQGQSREEQAEEFGW